MDKLINLSVYQRVLCSFTITISVIHGSLWSFTDLCDLCAHSLISVLIHWSLWSFTDLCGHLLISVVIHWSLWSFIDLCVGCSQWGILMPGRGWSSTWCFPTGCRTLPASLTVCTCTPTCSMSGELRFQSVPAISITASNRLAWFQNQWFLLPDLLSLKSKHLCCGDTPNAVHASTNVWSLIQNQIPVQELIFLFSYVGISTCTTLIHCTCLKRRPLSRRPKWYERLSGKIGKDYHWWIGGMIRCFKGLFSS